MAAPDFGIPLVDRKTYETHQDDLFKKQTGADLGALAAAQQQRDAARAEADAAFNQRAMADLAALDTGIAQQRQADDDFTQRAMADIQAIGAPQPAQPAPAQENAPFVQAGVPSNDPLYRAFGDLGPDVVANMKAIRQRESGGRADAHKNDEIEDSRGPLQVNARAHPHLAAKYDLFDPEQNARAAREVYDQQGYGAWFNASKQLGLLDGQRPGESGVPAQAAGQGGGPVVPPPEGGGVGDQLRSGARAEAVNQFQAGLSDEEAWSACGPVAALAFAQSNGRNPTLQEAMALARQSGWTPDGGMNGVANQKALLDRMGVASRLDTAPDFGQIAQDAESGNPVIISTPKHYYYVNGYDKATGRLHVGQTGLARKGGAQWMSAQQIAELDGGINGALFVDNPNSPTPSVAAGGPAAVAEPAGPPDTYDDGWNDQPEAPAPPAVGGSYDTPQARVRGVLNQLGDALLDLVGGAPQAAENLGQGAAGAIGQLPGGGAAVDWARSRGRGMVEQFNEENEAIARVFQPGATDEDWAKAGEIGLNSALTLGPEGLVRGSIKAVGGAADELKAGLDALEAAKVPVPRKLAEEAAIAPPSSAGFSQFWNRARNVIEQQGEAGRELGGMLRGWRNTAETMAGGWAAQLQSVRRLGDAEFKNFVDVAEGKAEPNNPMVAKAAEEWASVRADVYERAKAAGLDIGRIENYFPHIFEDGTFKGKGWQDAISHLVESGQASTRAEAAQALRRAQDVRRNRRYGNLEAEREADLPFYKRTKDVLFGQGGYLEAASNRIAQVETFGQKDADALALVDRIGLEGGDAGAAKALFDISVGATKYGDLQRKASGVARGFNTVTSLGLAAIANTGQIVNTAAVAGFGPVGRNIVKALRDPEAKEYAVKAGVTLDNVVQDIREGTGIASRALGKITAPGFSTVERFNRTLALHAGIAYAEDAARAGNLRALRSLGLDAEAVAQRGTLTDAEKITAGRMVVERTQFKVDPQDLPGWASHPVGKVFTQFKTFSYNQSAFMGREIVAPALEGDLRPLARFLVAGIAAGAITTETRNVIQNRESEKDSTKRILQYYQAVGGLGLAGDVLRVTSPILNINADRLDPDRVVTQAVGTALGPTVGKGIEVLSGISQATRGNTTPITRTALRNIPVVGTALQNLVVPYKPRPEPGAAPAGRESATPPRPPKAPEPPKPPKR